MIFSDFISKGMLFTDHDFRDLILDQYVQKYGNGAVTDIPDFKFKFTSIGSKRNISSVQGGLT